MSAFSDKGTMARAQAAQPLGFVGKPYDETRLRIALDAALKTLGEGRGLRRPRSSQVIPEWTTPSR